MLPPSGSANPTVLILGTLPSRRSMTELEYYAHPQNAFWWIMQHILQQPDWRDYEHKIGCLRDHRIQLWDVLSEAVRPGSLDSRIVSGTEQVNPLVAHIEKLADLRLIGFNGQKSQQLYQRHVHLMSPKDSFRLAQLPSTSPAHAAMSKLEKLTIWRSILKPCIEYD